MSNPNPKPNQNGSPGIRKLLADTTKRIHLSVQLNAQEAAELIAPYLCGYLGREIGTALCEYIELAPRDEVEGLLAQAETSEVPQFMKDVILGYHTLWQTEDSTTRFKVDGQFTLREAMDTFFHYISGRVGTGRALYLALLPLDRCPSLECLDEALSSKNLGNQAMHPVMRAVSLMIFKVGYPERCPKEDTSV